MPIIVTASVAWNNATEAEVARKNKQIVSLFAKWPTQCKLETNIKGNIHPKFKFSFHIPILNNIIKLHLSRQNSSNST